MVPVQACFERRSLVSAAVREAMYLATKFCPFRRAEEAKSVTDSDIEDGGLRIIEWIRSQQVTLEAIY